MMAKKKTSKKLASIAGRALQFTEGRKASDYAMVLIGTLSALAASVLSQYEHEKETMKRVQKKKRKEVISADPKLRGQRNKRKQQSRKARGKK